MNYFELTDEEKVNLDIEKFNQLTKIHALENGFKSLVKPEEPDSTFCTIENLYEFGNFLFKDITIAEKIRTIIEENKEDVYINFYSSYSLDQKTVKHPGKYNLGIEKIQCITFEEIKNKDLEFKRYNKLNQKYKDDLKAYERDQEILMQSSELFIEEKYEALDRIEQKEKTLKTWQSFLDTANNDYEIAKKFWQKSYPGVSIPE